MNLVIERLTKRFGDKTAVDELSICAGAGQAFALLGGNGAGKTTTIRMILGLIQPDDGEIQWQGRKLVREQVRIGYLPEERGLYPKVTVLRQLVYFGRLQGLSKAQARDSAQRLLERLEMVAHRDQKVEELSKGNQQKIQLAAALIHDPALVILDEPFSGLDPVNAQLLQGLIRELVAAGKTLLFSSHQMDYVEALCEHISILRQGKTVLSGHLPTIKRSYERTTLVMCAERELAPLLDRPGVKSVIRRADGYEVTLTHPQVAQPLLHACVAADVGLTRFELSEPSLRDIFIEKVGGQE